jgi:hypothetical protein
MTGAVPDQRRLDPVATVEPAVIHAAVVTHEVAIDLEIGARPEADHVLIAGVDTDVAALGAAGTDARRLVEIPGPRLVQEVLRDQRPYGAQVHDVAGPGMVQLLLAGDADIRPISTFRDIEHRFFGNVLHEADAASAEDAAIGHVQDVRTEIFDRAVPLGILRVAGAGAPLLENVVLELALARLIADRAIERMVDQ